PEGWNGYNLLNRAASRVAALDLGFLPGEGGRDLEGILSGAEAGEIELVWLLGADEIDMARLRSEERRVGKECRCGGSLNPFQAEDGIRDFHVTGVQTCALPISRGLERIQLAQSRGQPRRRSGPGFPAG